jgi:TRAP transporter TAXI family solute receptor
MRDLGGLLRGLLLLACGLAIALAIPTSGMAGMPPPKAAFMSMGTSSAGGSFFPLAGAMAGVIGKYYPQLKINAEITGGSVDNVKLMMNNKLELALISAEPAYDGYRGLGKFKSTGAVTVQRGLMAGHGNVWQLYTLKKTGIKSIHDLKGKKVSLGSTGSDGNTMGKLVIEAHGLIMGKDWTPEYLSHGDGPGALRDGRVDAVLIVSSTPTATVTDITSTHGADVVFLNPDPAILEKLVKQIPYYAKASIPGGTYNGHPQDIPGTFKLSALLCAHESVPDETAYAIVKTLLEHNDDLVRANALGKLWNRDGAVAPLMGVIPLHPGAEQYYKEHGLLPK